MIYKIGARCSFYTLRDMATPFELGYGKIVDCTEGVRDDEYQVFYEIETDFEIKSGEKMIKFILRDEKEVNPDVR